MKYIHLLLLSFLFTACSDQNKLASSSVNIGEGQMPALAKDADNNIHLVYGIGDSIMYTSSADGGATFIAPVLVDTLADLVDFATRGPQIAATKNGVAIIAVNQQGDIFSYSKDQSNKWLKAVRVNDTDTTNKEGFLGLSSDGNNKLFAIWPDLRDNNLNKIFGAQSTDGGQIWNKNVLVYASPDSTVCECCRPSVLMHENHVYVMFRNFLHGNRDLYLIQSDDAGTTFGTAQKLGNGSWQLDGCPMDGGSISMNAQNVQTVWRRRDSIFSAIPGKAEQFISVGKGCTVAAKEDATVYAWVKDGKILYKINDSEARVIGDGNSPVVQVIDGKSFICAWTDNGIIKSRLVSL
ncbi:MAG TPA: hypothetical protein PKL37_23600 [Panacibacter sp.]|nr:hypothetical protein [Panacibacter sp.]